MSEALNTLAGSPVTVTLSTGKALTLRAAPAFKLFTSVVPLIVGNGAGAMTLGEGGLMLALTGPNASKAIAVMTGLPEAAIDALEPQDAIALIEGCLEANRDFFSRRLGPSIEMLTSSLLAKFGAPATSPAASTGTGSGESAASGSGPTSASG